MSKKMTVPEKDIFLQKVIINTLVLKSGPLYAF